MTPGEYFYRLTLWWDAHWPTIEPVLAWVAFGVFCGMLAWRYL